MTSFEVSVVTEEDYEAQKEAAHAKGVPLLLQVGSEKCERCPAFHDAIAALTATHRFAWVYCDAHNPDTELTEKFAITKLPAFVIDTYGSDSEHVVANASPEQLAEAVAAKCTPVLQLDADF